MNKNSQIHFYIETSVLQDLQRQADAEGITLSKLCREKLRDYSILANLQETLNKINQKIAKEGKILNLLKLAIKYKLNPNGR